MNLDISHDDLAKPDLLSLREARCSEASEYFQLVTCFRIAIMSFRPTGEIFIVPMGLKNKISHIRSK